MPLVEIKAAEREAAAAADPLVVRFYGEDFTCASDVGVFPLLKMAGSDASNMMAVMSAFYGFLQSLFVPGDWERFEVHCLAHNVGFTELQTLLETISEEIIGRPTPAPSGSPSGPPADGARSRVVSLSPATTPPPVRRDPAMDERGRPA